MNEVETLLYFFQEIMNYSSKNNKKNSKNRRNSKNSNRKTKKYNVVYEF